MKKWIAILLTLILCVTLTACTGEQPESSVPAADSSTTTGSISTSAGDNAGTATTGTTAAQTTTAGTSGTSASATTMITTTTTATKTTVATKPPEAAPAGSTPLLYKVTDGQGHTVWLFGSVHVGRDSFYPLPAYVTDAFNAADALAVECDIVAFEKDTNAQINAMAQLVYTDGTTISAHLPAELYQNAVAILQENQVYDAALDYYCPAMWSSFIDSALYEKIGINAEKGIDRYLINTAKAQNKLIVEIESAQQQYAMLAGFSEPLQQLLLRSSVEQYGDISSAKAQLDSLLNAWESGNAADLGRMLAEEVEFANDTERQLYEEYNNAMTVARNKAMADYAENALRTGKKVFICVGAAHVVGEGAMAELLAAQGYKVEVVK